MPIIRRAVTQIRRIAFNKLCRQITCFGRVIGIGLLIEIYIVRCIQHFEFLRHILHATLGAKLDLRLSTLPLFCCDKNHSVRCANTIDRRGRCVLQDRDRFDVVRIDRRHYIDRRTNVLITREPTTGTAFNNGNTINNVERFGISPCSHSPDLHIWSWERTSARRPNEHTGHPPLHSQFRSHVYCFGNLLAAHGRDRAREVFLFAFSISNDHYLAKLLR